MHPVAVFDLIAFLAVFIALIMVLRSWKRVFRADTKFLFAGLLVSSCIYELCLFLQWSGVTQALEVLEDLVGALVPMWWAFVLYALLREVAEKSLTESEERYRDIFERSLDGFAEATMEGKFIRTNNAFQKMVGYTAEELSKLAYQDLTPKKWHKMETELMQSAIKGDYMPLWQKEYRKKDGTTVPVEIRAYLRGDKEGNPIGMWAVVRDITERKKAEEQLKKEEAEFRLILDSLPIIVFYKDREGRFIRVNKTFAEALDIPEEKFVGKTVLDFYSDDIARKMTNDDRQVLESGEPNLNIVEQYESKQGKRWVQTDKIPIFDDSGKVTGLVGFAQDITEQKRAEEELKTSEKNYKALFEGAPDGIIVADMKTGQYVHVNSSICKKLGYTDKEIKDLSQFRGIHPKEETDRIKDLFYRQAKGEIDIAEDIPFVRKDGTILYFDVASVHVEFDGVQRVVGLLRDITERKKIDKMRDNLIRDVSHSLKSPIALTKMACDMIEKGIASGDVSQVKRGEAIASTNSSKALRDVESILKMSFVEETKKAEIMKPISLNKTISGIIKDSEFQIKAKNLKVNVDIPKDADKVLMNARDSLLLFTNVINNAIKFTEKGNIKIEAAVEKSLVEMRVTDTGRGVGLNEIDKVFDKFYKRHAALPGTGLGLSICKEITERNKGEIEVRSKGLNKGTTVIVRLPKAPEKGGKK